MLPHFPETPNFDAETALTQATTLRLQGQDAASREYSLRAADIFDITRLELGSMRAWHEVARSYQIAGDWHMALESLEEAMRHQPQRRVPQASLLHRDLAVAEHRAGGSLSAKRRHMAMSLELYDPREAAGQLFDGYVAPDEDALLSRQLLGQILDVMGYSQDPVQTVIGYFQTFLYAQATGRPADELAPALALANQHDLESSHPLLMARLNLGAASFAKSPELQQLLIEAGNALLDNLPPAVAAQVRREAEGR